MLLIYKIIKSFNTRLDVNLVFSYYKIYKAYLYKLSFK